MNLAAMIRSWAEFFSETPVEVSGRKEEREETEETEETIYKEIFHFFQNFHNFLPSTTLPPFLSEFLNTRGSQPKRALATYLLRGALTDSELGTELDVEDASVIRNKESIKGKTEPQSEEKPTRYGLTAAARVQEEQLLREWLQGRLDALERGERLEKAREDEALAAGKGLPVSGSLRADLAERFRRGDYAVPVAFSAVAEHDPDLAEAVLDHPAEALKAGALALQSFDPKPAEEPVLLVEGLPSASQLSLREVRAEHRGRLVELLGEPESVSEVRPICTSARFECPSCGNIIPVLQLDQKFKEPTACGCGRRGRFRLLDKRLVDYAIVGLTQPLGEVLGGQGRRAQMKLAIDGALTTPGRMAHVAPGLPLRVVAVPVEEPLTLRSGGQSRRFDLVLRAVSFAPVEDYSFSLSFSEEEIASFQAAAAEEGFLDAFAESAFPSHYGDAHIKRAVALLLLRGRFDSRADRESLNILLSGDPGTGKTRDFLRRAVALSPVGRFVQATNSTQAGLLGSASTKDQDSGRFVYEPGALPRAHRGLLAIDEIAALLPEETKALNEALEEGSITIDKATLHLVVPADVAVLAAGNPTGGRFDAFSGVTAEKLGIEPSTLDRFDLVYVLVDAPEAERDGLVVDRMNATDGKTQAYPDEWLRRFILYARYAVHPVLRAEEAAQLKAFYVAMRQSSVAGTLTVSPRQYRSLRALTLLSAKLHLRSETQPEDVKVATALLEPMLKAFGFDMNNLQRVM